MTQENPVVWGAAWRNKAQAGLALAVGVISLLTGGFFLYLSHSDSTALDTYNSAVACASAVSAATGPSCRFEGPASIVSTSRNDRPAVVITFAALPGRRFGTGFWRDHQPAGTLSAGETVPAELWDGKVTHLAGTMTYDDPEGSQASGYLITGGILWAWTLVIFFLAIPLARKAWSQG